MPEQHGIVRLVAWSHFTSTLSLLTSSSGARDVFLDPRRMEFSMRQIEVLVAGVGGRTDEDFFLGGRGH